MAVLLVPRAEAEAHIRQQITRGVELLDRALKRPAACSAEGKQLARDAQTWSDDNVELLKRIADSDEWVADYRSSYGAGGLALDLGEHEPSVIECRIDQLEFVNARLDLVAGPPDRRVFIVHGHDNEAKQSVARCLERLGLQAIILHEQPNRGRTIIEKFEDYAEVSFAVVLLTPDDVGAAVEDADHLQPRARQNVILELGYFAGRLGRDRVCALHKGGVEIPSDFSGVLWVEMDVGGAWQFRLAREIEAAGLEVDLNRLG